MRSIKTETGVVNSNYRGNISVVLDNPSNKRIEFSVGDRIAQVIFWKISSPVLEEVLEFKDTRQRNKVGLGSTNG